MIHYTKSEILSAAYFYLRQAALPLNWLWYSLSPISKTTQQPLPQNLKEEWDNNGILHLRNVFSKRDIDPVNQLVDQLWGEQKLKATNLTIDVFINSGKHRRIHMHEAPSEAREEPYKLNDLYLDYSVVQQLALNDRLVPILSMLLHGTPVICNSLNFERGSEQELHVDSFFMAPLSANRMVASWVALEDCHADSGPLRYVVGSHKIPPYRFSSGLTKAIGAEMESCHSYYNQQIQQRGLETKTIAPRAGDVLIWHAQLMHGGSTIRDSTRTRRSLVTHYYRAEDQVPLLMKQFAPGLYHLRRKPQRVKRTE